MFRIAERERMVHDIGQEGAGLTLCRNPWGTNSPGKVLDHFLNLQMWAASFHKTLGPCTRLHSITFRMHCHDSPTQSRP